MSLKNQKNTACKGCGDNIKYSFRNKQVIPKYCSTCKEAYSKKWHVKKCINSGCETSFMIFEGWAFIPDLCDKCREKKKMTTGSCVDCGVEITFSRDTIPPPVRCEKCEATKVDATCRICTHTFSCQPKKFHGKIPVFCPTCWTTKKENEISKICLGCQKLFSWNKLWGEPQGGYCPKCQTKERETLSFLLAHQSKTSWTLNAEPEFYESINQTLHFSEGKNKQKKHVWTDEFSGKDANFIIQSAVELAASTKDGVLEFRTSRKKYLGIKYNTKNNQVVIFNTQSLIIITTFQFYYGMKDVVRNVINMNWEKV